MNENLSKERSSNYVRQVKGALVCKFIAMAASYLTIPLMLKYLGQEQFGVWSTLLTVMSWIVFFDLGIGNGLRNKVAEAMAKGSDKEAANYIASAYTVIGIIAAITLTGILAGSYLIPWRSVFNTNVVSEVELRKSFQIAACFILLNFWIGLINALLGALQKTALTTLGQLISNMLVLVLVFALTKSTNASISSMAIVYGLALVLSNASLSAWFYVCHPKLRPRVYLDRAHVHPLLSVGMQFFTIQIAGLIIFTTDKMMITQLFGPQYVAQYDVVFKLFSAISIAYALISAPLWSSYTDAYHRGDIPWIKKTLHRQTAIFLIVTLAVMVMTPLAKPIVGIWVGHAFKTPMPIVYAMGPFVLISNWTSIFSCFLNGVQKIRVSWIISIIAMIINIPVGILLAKYTPLGVSSIIIGTICVLIPSAILGPYQVYKIIDKRDTGVWGR